MITRMLSISIVMLIATTLTAQRRDERRGQRPDERRDGGDNPPRIFGGPPGFHLAAALDTNADGKISTEEIENATAALQTLDKDNDGKLSGEEIGWPPSFGCGPPGFGPPGGGPPGFRGRPGRGGFPGFGGQQGPARRPDPDADTSRQTSLATPSDRPGRRSSLSARQLKSNDRNQDGKITAEEIPKLLRESILKRVDTNKDGVIDKSELDALAKQETQQE